MAPTLVVQNARPQGYQELPRDGACCANELDWDCAEFMRACAACTGAARRPGFIWPRHENC